MDASLAATRWAWVYYVSFVVLAVFVVINLFIAIVINNLEAAKREDAEPRPEGGNLPARLAEIRDRLAEVEAALRASKERY
jgi:voltage-gated sodium channel